MGCDPLQQDDVKILGGSSLTIYDFEIKLAESYFNNNNNNNNNSHDVQSMTCRPSATGKKKYKENSYAACFDGIYRCPVRHPFLGDRRDNLLHTINNSHSHT